jgi:hypothetical protein
MAVADVGSYYRWPSISKIISNTNTVMSCLGLIVSPFVGVSHEKTVILSPQGHNLQTAINSIVTYDHFAFCQEKP